MTKPSADRTGERIATLFYWLPEIAFAAIVLGPLAWLMLR